MYVSAYSCWPINCVYVSIGYWPILTLPLNIEWNDNMNATRCCDRNIYSRDIGEVRQSGSIFWFCQHISNLIFSRALQSNHLCSTELRITWCLISRCLGRLWKAEPSLIIKKEMWCFQNGEIVFVRGKRKCSASVVDGAGVACSLLCHNRMEGL